MESRMEIFPALKEKKERKNERKDKKFIKFTTQKCKIYENVFSQHG